MKYRIGMVLYLFGFIAVFLGILVIAELISWSFYPMDFYLNHRDTIISKIWAWVIFLCFIWIPAIPTVIGYYLTRELPKNPKLKDSDKLPEATVKLISSNNEKVYLYTC